MDTLIKIAADQLGQKEIDETKENKQTINNYALEAGFEWKNNEETPWCSIFLNWCALKAGLKGSGKANARSWLLTGWPTYNPEPGDTVVFWSDSPNSWKGHVGIFLGFSKEGSRVYCLGGNDGNQVSIAAYPIANVLGYQRLSASPSLSLPTETLKKGDQGQEVKILQDALKMAGFECGTSDGVFGKKTEMAIMALQRMNDSSKIDGIFCRNTKNFLNILLSD